MSDKTKDTFNATKGVLAISADAMVSGNGTNFALGAVAVTVAAVAYIFAKPADEPKQRSFINFENICSINQTKTETKKGWFN